MSHASAGPGATSGATSGIVEYNLFGEHGDLPDVMHCETINARAAMHDWEVSPHRHARLHQILLVSGGGGLARLEEGEHRLEPGLAVNVPSGAIHGFSFLPATQGWVVTLAGEMLDEILEPREGVKAVLARPFVAAAVEPMTAVMVQIQAEFTARRFARAQLLRSLCGVLTGLAARSADYRPAEGQPAGGGLPERFDALLDDHFLDHWGVADYADAMAVTPAHLSRTLRAATGQTASQMIRDRLIREARRQLVYTNLSVSAVAYLLGFDDPAYFSRVFAAATGQSPRVFRERLRHAGEG